MTEDEIYKKAKARAEAKMGFYRQAASSAGIIVILAGINLITSPGYFWFLWAALGMSIGLAFRAVKTFGDPKLEQMEEEMIEKELEKEKKS